jgi:hypothetical protein
MVLIASSNSDDLHQKFNGLPSVPTTLARSGLSGQEGQSLPNGQAVPTLRSISTQFASANVADILAVWGYSMAQTMVAVLKDCGNDLTRENVMKHAANLHNLTLPMILPGITLSTNADDFAPIKHMQLMKFDGVTWKLFGEVTSADENQR